ncbi:MAG: hypothetical protein ACTSV5_14810 [Promethearchaeota archaeon]
MLHQIENRIFGIFIIQPIVIIIFIYVAIRILKRNRNLITITLSAFYILSATGFIANIFFIMGILLPVELVLIPSILYFISSFLVIFSPIFLLIFLFLIKQQDFSNKSYILLSLFYGLGCLLLILMPEGIDIGIHTNWIPKYSWTFLIIFYIFFSLIIIIPTIYLLTKLLISFQDRDLRKKFFIFLIGVSCMLISIYGVVLYNTWHDPTFRIIWSIISLIVIPAGLLIYNGIGQNL